MINSVGPAAALCVVQVALGSPVDYRVDNGNGGGNSGFQQASDILWGNYFFAQPGGEVITSISAAFGNIDGRPITVRLFDDPDDDGNPANAVLLASLSAVAQRPVVDFFAEYALAPTAVSGGFFVAIQRITVAGEFPLRRDNANPSQGRSWIAAAPAATGLDLSNLGGSPIFFNQPATLGNFMVRALGIPAPSTGLLLATSLVVMSRRRRGKSG